MTQKVWLGRIYLKEEGGYEIILKSLCHYKNRLKTLGSSPEVQDSAAMFASVLNQQARKTVPKIEKTIKKIQAGLNDSRNIGELEEDISFFEKALQCYKSDIGKAENTGHEYFAKLIKDMPQAKKDMKVIDMAIKKIREYSE